MRTSEQKKSKGEKRKKEASFMEVLWKLSHNLYVYIFLYISVNYNILLYISLNIFVFIFIEIYIYFLHEYYIIIVLRSFLHNNCFVF